MTDPDLFPGGYDEAFGPVPAHWTEVNGWALLLPVDEPVFEEQLA